MRASEWQYLCAVHDPPKSCSAIDYCCHTLDWAATTLTSSKLFPSRLGLGSAAGGSGGERVLQSQMKELTNIFRRVYRIYAHAWFQHRDAFWRVEGKSGLYVFFKTVCDEYGLIQPENYTIPPEAEGLEAVQGEEEGEEEVEKQVPKFLRRQDGSPERRQQQQQQGGNEVLAAGDTTKRHRHALSGSGGSVTGVIQEEAEEEEEQDGEEKGSAAVPPVEQGRELSTNPDAVLFSHNGTSSTASDAELQDFRLSTKGPGVEPTNADNTIPHESEPEHAPRPAAEAEPDMEDDDDAPSGLGIKRENTVRAIRSPSPEPEVPTLPDTEGEPQSLDDELKASETGEAPEGVESGEQDKEKDAEEPAEPQTEMKEDEGKDDLTAAALLRQTSPQADKVVPVETAADAAEAATSVAD